MRQSIAILFILSSISVAADTIQFFYPGGTEGVDPVATIKNANPTVTEFRIACPTNVDSTECGWGSGMNYTISAKTHYQASMKYDSVDMSMACDHNTMASEMTCTGRLSAGNNDDSIEPETAVFRGDEVKFNSATVIQGANLLSGGAASATPAVNASPKATTAAGGSGLMTDVSPTATASGMRGLQGNATRSASGSAAPAEQTGAAPTFGMHGVAVLVLTGLVAFVAQ